MLFSEQQGVLLRLYAISVKEYYSNKKKYKTSIIYWFIDKTPDGKSLCTNKCFVLNELFCPWPNSQDQDIP